LDHNPSPLYNLLYNGNKDINIPGADPGGAHPARAPLKLEKIWFFGVKSWFFTRNTPTIFAPPSARRNFSKCAPSNLKSWIRPCIQHKKNLLMWILFIFSIKYPFLCILSHNLKHVDRKILHPLYPIGICVTSTIYIEQGLHILCTWSGDVYR
jgi:hypothetical protein